MLFGFFLTSVNMPWTLCMLLVCWGFFSSPFTQLPFGFLCFLKLLLPRVHNSESNLIQVDSVLVSVQFKVISFGSQQNITQSLTELLRIFTPYQQLISNYFSAHRSLKIQDMMIRYTFCAETIMKGSSLNKFLPEREWRDEHF